MQPQILTAIYFSFCCCRLHWCHVLSSSIGQTPYLESSWSTLYHAACGIDTAGLVHFLAPGAATVAINSPIAPFRFCNLLPTTSSDVIRIFVTAEWVVGV